ncbi:MAG TPA: D-alanyl-D-alanine carboxypeptidase/D-alanyl-D-alanine-endopeptidase [Longimicrobiales bacterium]|nr:D-alanyl-D-alanine carboxypeptidase/D-alanyl-D-alanine-endopeptidase [Longimicrobiales bacterium]
MATRQKPSRAMIASARIIACAALLLTIAGCRPLPPETPRPPAPAPALASAIDAIISSPPLDRAQWGILIADAATGQPIYSLNPELLFVPASNAKLATAAAALEELGPEYRYLTRVYAIPGPADSIAAAILVRASGDPSMSERFQAGPYAVMDSLADSLAAAGIRRISGSIVIDVSRFTGESVLPSWEVGDLSQYYAPPTGAFGVEEATVRVAVRPAAAPGQPAIVQTMPEPDLVEIDNGVRTSPEGTPLQLTFEVDPRGTLIVSGSVPAGADTTIVRTMAAPDASDHAARAMLAALRRRGIDAAGVVVVGDSAEARAMAAAGAADGPMPVATWSSPPLASIVHEMLKDSPNWIAEQVTRTLGAERGDAGSWAAGLEVQRRFLIDVVGIDSTAFVLRDGSGLSTKNLLTPAAAVALLEHARAAPWGGVFFAGLPVAGTDGTLETRLEGVRGQVSAKTGSLTHVNTLSGYARTRSGRDVVFSIFTNASGQPAALVREAMDRVVELVVTGAAGYW